VQSQRDLAIVLRCIPYEERHRIVTALTLENGLVSALAKNSIQSRRFGGSLELFSASDWIFTCPPGAELYRLSEAQIREPFENLRKNFHTMSLASVLNELIIKLAPKNEPCPELFRLHSNALDALNTWVLAPIQREGQEIAFLNAYLAKLLQVNGNQPRLHECLQCGISIEKLEEQSGNSAVLNCVISSASWICASCSIHSTAHLQTWVMKITSSAAKDHQLSLSIPIRQITSRFQATLQEHQQLFKFLEALFIFHIPGFDQLPLKSLRFLDLESNLQHSKVTRQ
jgi:DNA repair protein RecO